MLGDPAPEKISMPSFPTMKKPPCHHDREVRTDYLGSDVMFPFDGLEKAGQVAGMVGVAVRESGKAGLKRDSNQAVPPKDPQGFLECFAGDRVGSDIFGTASGE